MPRRTEHEDDWSDEFGPDPDEEFDGSDDDDEEEPTVPCPYCRKEIHEDSQHCPHCGNFISKEDTPPARKPWWLILGTLACLYVIYRWIVG